MIPLLHLILVWIFFIFLNWSMGTSLFNVLSGNTFIMLIFRYMYLYILFLSYIIYLFSLIVRTLTEAIGDWVKDIALYIIKQWKKFELWINISFRLMLSLCTFLCFRRLNYICHYHGLKDILSLWFMILYKSVG